MACIAYGMAKRENLKPPPTVRMCSGRQVWEEPFSVVGTMWHPSVVLMLYQTVTLLSKGATFLPSPIPKGYVCSIPRDRIQDLEAPAWEKTGRVLDSTRQQSQRSHYRIRKVPENLTSKKDPLGNYLVLSFSLLWPHQQELKDSFMQIMHYSCM